MQSSKKSSNKFWFILAGLLSLSGLVVFLNLNEDLRFEIRNYILSDKREILAKAQGELVPGRQFSIIKIKTKEALSIEVYEYDAVTGRSNFLTRAILPEHRDGYFMYHDNAVSLMLLDVNQDGAPEIITSAFDENLLPRMHVYKFDETRNSLEPIGADTVKL